MDWIHDFQLFLFDFDGLLVNTEHIHFQAYINMLARRGFTLDWSFSRYCEAAHLHADAIREGIYAQFPDLPPDWKMLYSEKKAAYQELLMSAKVELMKGVEPLLEALAKHDIRRCVVTHSPLDQIKLIRKHHAILETLPHWITREDYEKPKPSGECYLKAIQLYGKKGDRIIGFEDSIRGLKALLQTPAQAVLICPSHHPLLELSSEGALHFESFEEISAEKLDRTLL